MATHEAYRRALEQRDQQAAESRRLDEVARKHHASYLDAATERDNLREENARLSRSLADANTDALLTRVKELGETNEKLRGELAASATRGQELAHIARQLNDRLFEVNRENVRLRAELDRLFAGGAPPEALRAARDETWRAAVRKAGQDGRLCECATCADLLALMRGEAPHG